MPKAPKDPAKNVKGEHIFQASVLEPLALGWKEDTKRGRHDKAGEKLEEIVKLSTPMFIRLAQHEGFQHTVDLDTLVLAAQARVATWLLYWDPAKGRMFTFFSKCAKYVFLAEVVRTSQHRKRYHSTPDSLEKFIGSEDNAVSTREALEAIDHTLRDLHARWGDKQALDCVRFHIACVVENPRGNKKKAIKAGAYASGLSVDMSKFFYNWALFLLRDAMYDKLALPYTEQDLFRLRYSYTYLPDLLTVITWQQMLKVIALLGGMRVKFPTITQLQQLKRDYAVFRRVDTSSKTPKDIETAADESGISTSTAEEIYQTMSAELQEHRDEETPLYGSH